MLIVTPKAGLKAVADGDITSNDEAQSLAGIAPLGFEIKVVQRFDCPLDTRLARTPYFVLPKLAIQSMPFAWRDRFEALLVEMDEAGLATPEYHVFRDDGPGGEFTRARVVNQETGFVRICGGRDDPWANYRHGSAAELCPGFVRPDDPNDKFVAKVFPDGTFENLGPPQPLDTECPECGGPVRGKMRGGAECIACGYDEPCY